MWGIFELGKNGNFGFVTMQNGNHDFFIPKDRINGAQSGEKVVVRLTNWPEGSNSPFGEVSKVLGNPDDTDVEIHAILFEYDLPAKWFGVKGTVTLTLPSSAQSNPDNVTHRILINGWYDVSGASVQLVQKPSENAIFLWAGDSVPYTGQVYNDHVRKIDVTVASTTIPAEYYYKVDPTIAFVLIHKSALPFMSGFETGTEFFNGRSLTSTNYLIFGHNNLEFLEEYPRIRVRVVNS